MDETICVVLKVLFNFALKVWFSIYLNELTRYSYLLSLFVKAFDARLHNMGGSRTFSWGGGEF